ncbi:hypothetical protein [Caminibacter pacificus]
MKYRAYNAKSFKQIEQVKTYMKPEDIKEIEIVFLLRSIITS